ncbi:hypothetical protein [Magnetospirillum sp. UT-4]|uniref:hypothetical protein n=1 Tax=Magnetospirillum sp. UT-4 TaxID=2681467 RepID=UPI0015731872|nr:hypothetical protein [Magnetospirillum sp. UT-4]
MLSDVLRQIGVGTIKEADSTEYAILMGRYISIDLIIWADLGRGYLPLLKHFRQGTNGPNRAVPFLCIAESWSSEQLAEARDAGVSAFGTFPIGLRSMLKSVTTILASPLEFIDVETYVGPDRRRRDLANYQGPCRRATDDPARQFAGAEDGSGQSARPSPKSALPAGAAAAEAAPRPAAVPAVAASGGGGVGAVGSARSPGAPVAEDGPPAMDRRVQVVHQAFRLAVELQGLLPTTSDIDTIDKLDKINDLFDRLTNLMGLVHSYCIEETLGVAFFRSKYTELNKMISSFSLGVLAAGIERTVRKTSAMAENSEPIVLGSSYKLFHKMSGFESLIRLIGGHAALSPRLLERMVVGWRNVLSLAERDAILTEMGSEEVSTMRLVASQSLAGVSQAMRERLAAASQDETFKRLKDVAG